jgi:Fe-S-cluster containining protein
MIKVETAPEPAFEDGKCGQCTALCCSHIALEICTPTEREDFENLRWYLIHEDTQIFVDDGVWFLQVFRKCTWLDGNKCGNYENRPTICAEYSNELCDFDGIESDMTFKDVMELEAYRDRFLKEQEELEFETRLDRRRRLKKKLKKLRAKKAAIHGN